MDRTINFTMPNNPNMQVKSSETNDGKLLFDLTVLGKADLRGFFFDIKQPTNVIKNLQVEGANITDKSFADEGVTNLKGGVNINGSKSKFDVGIAFGSPGKGKDLIQKTSFTLTKNGNPLTLDSIANTEFGVRLTNKSAKETLIAPAAPDAINDAIKTDEDTSTDETEPNKNLLANDTDADGDTLTVVAINGNPTLVGNSFTLPTGGLVTVHSNGTFDLDPHGQYDDLGVGETRTDSFTYRITDELLDPNNQGFDSAIANITITGVNDPPIISVGSGDSNAEILVETNTGIKKSKTITVSDVDKTDVVKASVISVETGGNNKDPSIPNQESLLSMLTVNPNLILDATQTTAGLNWVFNSNGEAFNYLADDENLVLTYTIQAQDDNGASDTETITITIDGTNDQPIAQELNLDIGEDNSIQTFAFIASDVDTSDQLSYQILGQPTDSLGHQYGKVTNNDDGKFTFDPLDNFQFLDAGESRDVTFSYVAVDDSGTANSTSEPKTVRVKVNGSNDDPKDLTDQLLFQSNDQSMFGTGPAVVINPNLDFLGKSWNYSFDKTLIEAKDFGVLDVDFFSTPEVSLNGATSGRVGVQPYFFLTSGDVDSSIPVDVKFIVPHQVEEGETFNIQTQYSINGATFNTQSPAVKFGLDLIFKVAANANVNVSSSSFGDGRSWELFNFHPDELVKNLFNFSSADDLQYELEFPASLGSLNINFPDIATTGTQIDSNTLTSEGSDTIVESNLDLDALVTYLSGVPFGASYSKSFFDNAVKLSASLEFIDAKLIGTLSAIQDFKLDIEDLPLKLTLEDGTDITGVSVGDSLSITAPNNFDPDTAGDKDGLIDFGVDIDMDAVFKNMTGLSFDLDLFLGIMKATAGIKIDIPVVGNVVDKTFNLFPTDNGFLFSDTYDLLNKEVNIFNKEFALKGFNQETFAGAFDVA